MKILMKIAGSFDHIVDSGAVLAAVLLIFTVLLIATGVIFRYFFHSPIIWIIAISEAFLLYITFLAATWILKKERHVRMDVLVNRLNPRTQAMLGVINSIIGVIVCFVITWYGVKVTWVHFQIGYIVPGVVELPKAPIIIIIPICSLLLFIQFLRQGYGYMGVWKSLSS